MSLNRFVYYSGLIGGWAAFAAWLVLEAVFLRGGSNFSIGAVAGVGAAVGASIGAGLSLVSGMTNPQWERQLERLPAGLIGGGVGGGVGGLIGQLVLNLGLPLALGWVVMGLAVGAAEGIYERSPRKLRNGLIGGGVGGFVGGLLFTAIASAMSDLSGRAVAFTVLGISVGLMIGLAHVVLKEAWLTVVEGFRPGRQLILSQEVTVLGRGDHLPLPFLGYPGRDLDSEHLRIIRQPDGGFLVEDNHSRLGTVVNGRPIQGPVTLTDGDLIRLGSNIVRLNLRQRASPPAAAPPPGTQPRQRPPTQPGRSPSGPRIPPPPPPPARPA